MTNLTYASILICLMATAEVAAAGECPNCLGDRVVGGGPVRWACPVCGGSGAVPDPKPVPAEPVASVAAAPGRPRPVVARITAASGPSRVHGSGVLVSASGTTAIVLTNWHVVRSHRDSVSVLWPDGKSSPGRVIASDDAWDLAAILVPRPDAAPVSIAASAPKIGDRLTIAGYGVAGRYLEQSGPATDYGAPTKSHPSQFVELLASARQGDSGGPIFNDQGELAGVLFGERDGRTIGPCSTRLRAFLDGVPAESAPVRSTSSTSCPGGRCEKR